MQPAFIPCEDVPAKPDLIEKRSEARASRIHRPETTERRTSNRFPIRQELRYRVVNNPADNSAGTGLTHDMSSTGIRFSTEERIQPGRMVEVAVNWPARLDGVCPLKVVAVGRVVRSDARWAAFSIQRYEFRTRRSGHATHSG